MVQEGDTLVGLSVVTGIPVDQLMQINCLLGEVIPGMQIWLPFTP